MQVNNSNKLSNLMEMVPLVHGQDTETDPNYPIEVAI